jgi:hypothetical protein
MKPPQSYPFRSIYWDIPISVTNNPRVCTKITSYDTHQPTLMSPRYSNVTTSTRELITWYASNNFRFIIFDPTQRTSKSDPRYLPKKVGRKRASTPMHRLPQCHLEIPRVECQNIHQVNQYNTPLSPRVFTCKTYIKCSQIHKSIQSDNSETSKVKLNSSQQDREGETPYDPTILARLVVHQDRAKSRTRERERDQTHSY